MLLDVLDERLNDTGIALGRRHMNSGIAGLRLKKLQLRDQADVATPRVRHLIDEHAMHDQVHCGHIFQTFFKTF